MKPSTDTLISSAGSHIVGQALFILGINCALGAGLFMLQDGSSLAEYLKICNGIGFCIWALVEAGVYGWGERVPLWVILICAIPLGFVIGCKLAAWAGAIDLIALLLHDPQRQWRMLAGNLMVAVFTTALIVFYFRAETLRADLEGERRRAAEALQSETTARFALLQAQIEPHFLFNTLANLQSVIESDPKAARAILDHFNRYLRASLGRSRRMASTVGEELELVGALLAIASMRLGERLRYAIEVSESIRGESLPPLLLQPLVENALKHGIEPALDGGEVVIEAERREGALLLRVRDSGMGLNPASPEGVGLSNVRARLASLYGERGRLALYENSPRGMIAELSLPVNGG
jgi:signal transduction histidine kinase